MASAALVISEHPDGGLALVGGGRSFTIPPVTRQTMLELYWWAEGKLKSERPTPLAAAAREMGGFKDFPHLQELLVKEAYAATLAQPRATVGMEELTDWLGSLDGFRAVLPRLLRAENGQPVGEGDVTWVLAHADLASFSKMLAAKFEAADK